MDFLLSKLCYGMRSINAKPAPPSKTTTLRAIPAIEIKSRIMCAPLGVRYRGLETEQMTKLLVEFGMTPSSRSRVSKVKPNKPEVNPRAALLTRAKL